MDDFDSIDKTVIDDLDVSGTQIGGGIRPQDLKLGSMFAGRYEILSQGFRGGMGVVYQCRDIKLQKQKALKIIHPHLLKSSQALQRFRQEVSISQELLNENIVRVYDLDEYQGQEFFTMEWVEGKNLRDLIVERKKESRPFTLEEAYEILSQLNDALQYAHRFTVHRDIKPENILIKEDGGKQIIKLTDFGIAKMLTTSQLTTTSIQMGTPYYMAPEQKLDTGHVDRRADIYSVGVILFELLTLENTIGPELPSDLNPKVPKEVDDAFRKAVALKPEKRYAEVGELDATLLKIVSAENGRLQQLEEKEQLKRKAAERQREEGSLNGEPKLSGENIHYSLSITLNESLDGAEKKIILNKANNEIDEIIVKIPSGIKTGQILRLSGEGKPGLNGGTNGDLYIKINVLQDVAMCQPVEEAAEQQREQKTPMEQPEEVCWYNCIKANQMQYYLSYIDMYPQGKYKFQAEKAIYHILLNQSGREDKENVIELLVEDSEKICNITTNSIGMTFVLIPTGTFMMGSPEDEHGRYEEETQHSVEISQSFYMQVTPVTQEQYEKVMGYNPSEFKSGGTNNPVESVSWNDAQAFIKELNRIEEKDVYRLPTEAEWEYACRAGSSAAFHFGDDENLLKDYAWYDANSEQRTHPVGNKKPNAWGLYDMYGNVWEWTQDRYGDYPEGFATDPKGPSWLWGLQRVQRGGSWYSNSKECRSSTRAEDDPKSQNDNVGFRLAMTI